MNIAYDFTMATPNPRRANSLGLAGVLCSILALWMMFAVLDTAGDILLHAPDAAGGFAHQLVVAGVGTILSLAMYAVMQALPPWSLRARLGVVAFLAAPAGIAFGFSYFWVHFVWWPTAEQKHAVAALGIRRMASEIVFENIIAWYFMFAAWGAVYLAMSYAAEVREAERRASQLRDQARIAELRTLRGQINPHFLFNVLNSLSALVMREDRAEAESMISEMASFLRANLAADPLEEVTLSEEIKMQERYLKLEGRRFPHRLSVKIDLQPGTSQALVPAMILQPLVENAVRHGVGRALGLVTVAITARLAQGDRLEIMVEDDAVASQDATEDGAEGFGIGLQNVSARLAARFDAAAEFEAGPSPDSGFRVMMRFPMSP
jgi:two-component system, LytTR family, sensor kinase